MTIRQLSRINWIIVGGYAIVCTIMLLGNLTTQTDAAGRGMAWGFFMVAALFTAFLAAMNLIRVRWVKYVVMAIGLVPVALFLLNQ
jgi:hypothetical protein